MKAPAFGRFDWRAALARAEAILAAPPAHKRVVRVAGVGRLLRRFALPIELCPTTNFTRHAHPGKNARTKADIETVMLVQTQGRKRRAPLPGRPMVIGVRFSSRAPDRSADGFKMAIDKLTIKNDGFGYLRDDSEYHCEQVQRWEYVPRGLTGFCILEIWTGAASGQVTT